MPDAVEDTAVVAAAGGSICALDDTIIDIGCCWPVEEAAALREVLGGETMRFDDDCNCGR